MCMLQYYLHVYVESVGTRAKKKVILYRKIYIYICITEDFYFLSECLSIFSTSFSVTVRTLK